MINAQPKRIIFIPFIDAFGGAERLILDLSRFLNGREVPHLIACFRQSIDLQSYADWPLQVHQIRPRRNPLSEARALNGFLSASRLSGAGCPLLFDLKSAFYCGIASGAGFFLHLTDPPSLLPADISKHSPFARHDHFTVKDSLRPGIVRLLRGDLVNRLNRCGARRASRIIVMTEKIRRELRDLYDVDSVVVRPGITSGALPHIWARPTSGPLRMLSVSRLEPNKRIDWILRALAALRSTSYKHAEWVFEIVGEGPENKTLKKLADELGLANRTSFLGHISDAELSEAYSRASLFLMPAVQGYGLPALEALNRGIPAIVHKDSGVSEILGTSPWVEIVDGENGSLATAIGSMFERLSTGVLSESGQPQIPESSDWAKAVCQVCGWI